MAQPKIKVVQVKQIEAPDPEKRYRVIQTQNTLIVSIGEYLAKDRVEELIGLGCDVTIVEPR